jgi:hypothetical protein
MAQRMNAAFAVRRGKWSLSTAPTNRTEVAVSVERKSVASHRGGDELREGIMKHALGMLMIATAFACGCGSSSKPTSQANASATSLEQTTATATTAAPTVNINMHAKGTINAVDFDGPIAGGSLECNPVTAGVEVIWSGSVDVKGRPEQISGDMSLKIGGTSFPNGGNASLVLGGNYQHRVGATTGAATADAKSGTINAQYAEGSDTASLEGTWRCT